MLLFCSESASVLSAIQNANAEDWLVWF